MNYLFASRTDPGLLRPNNEDALVVDSEHRLVLLADGMGGYNAGEVASAMAISQMRMGLLGYVAAREDGRTATPEEWALACMDDTNRRIFEAAQTHPEYEGMGTTLLMGWLLGTEVLIGHVGDSRAYLCRDGRLLQLTRDHSLLQEQIDAGRVDAAPVLTPAKHLLTRAVGVEPAVRLDLQRCRLQERDRLLLCSDGLTDMVDEDSLCQVLCQVDDLEEACAALVGLAKQMGGRDNISVILVQAMGQPRLRLPHWLGL